LGEDVIDKGRQSFGFEHQRKDVNLEITGFLFLNTANSDFCWCLRHRDGSLFVVRYVSSLIHIMKEETMPSLSLSFKAFLFPYKSKVWLETKHHKVIVKIRLCLCKVSWNCSLISGLHSSFNEFENSLTLWSIEMIFEFGTHGSLYLVKERPFSLPTWTDKGLQKNC
jgi:hypothetical protein